MNISTIPFSGFYNSIHDSEIDSYIEQEQEYAEDQNEKLYFDPDSLNYSGIYTGYAKAYTSEFIKLINYETGITLDAKFESLESPREYNFTTDRIFIEFDNLKPICDLFAWINSNHAGALNKYISEHFSSYDGFISYYPNNLEAWPTDLNEWDYNQIGALFGALFEIFDESDEKQIFEYDMLGDEFSNGLINSLIDENTPQ